MTNKGWLATSGGLGLTWLTACTVGSRSDIAPAPVRGEALYAQQCAFCHGEEGRGDGAAAPFLSPQPRDFGARAFRLVSTANGVPTDADLVRTLRRGIPGSAMPSFDWMEDGDLDALAGTARALAQRGRARDLENSGSEPAAAHAAAARELAPGAVLPEVAELPPSPVVLARGAELFAAHCARCHGAGGSGSEQDAAWDASGRFQWARDFTAGVMKGGASARELGWRICAGMPGSTMPPTPLAAADTAALVAHVQSLLRPGAGERLVQHRRTLRARRVAAAPLDPDAPEWGEASEAEVVLAPLIWCDDGVVAARVALLHDGHALAVRVRWADATRDDQPLGASAQADAVALAFATQQQPPLFGMGSAHHPVSIWHWKPFSAGDVSALLEQVPHRALAVSSGDRLDAPLYAPAPGTARAMPSAGFGSTPKFASSATTIAAQVRWRANEWSVVLRGPLSAPDVRMWIAFGVWNGSARDTDGQKSVTIWHVLDVE